MACKIISVKSKENKSLFVVLTTETNGVRQKYTISEGTYREIGCPLSGEVLNEDFIELVSFEDERRRALQKALNILAYADNNEKTLLRKLRLAGFSKESADFAKEECVRLGYIDEKRQIEHLILKCASMLYGPHKIIAKLISRSYSASLSIKLIKELEARGEIDFAESKKILLETKLDQNSTYEQKQKLLYKYGYKK